MYEDDTGLVVRISASEEEVVSPGTSTEEEEDAAVAASRNLLPLRDENVLLGEALVIMAITAKRAETRQ